MARPAKKTTRKRSPARKTTTKRSPAKKTTRKSTSSTLTPAQKKLKEQRVAPWNRIEALGYTDPVVYDIDWGNRSLASMIKAVNLSGVGYVTDGHHELAEQFLVPDYSWSSFSLAMCRRDKTTPHPEGENPDGYQLRKDQLEDQSVILNARDQGAPEFLIANGTGTGKTVMTWDTVKKLSPRTALIVCPAAVIPVWRQHITDMGDAGIKIVIINYESLKKLVAPPDVAIKAKKTTTQNRHIALNGRPYQRFDVVVFDEAHKLSNPTSQQSRIANKLANHAKFVMRLTATPGQDPAALHHLWRGLSWVTKDKVEVTDDKDFSTYTQWCQNHGVHGIVKAPFGNGITFQGDDDDLKTMNGIVYGDNNGRRLGIRRVPSDWDDTVRQPLTVTLSKQDQDAYQILVDDTFSSILEGVSKNRRDMTKGLAAMIALRQKTGMIKAPTVVDYTKYCLNDLGEQVVISAIFHRTVDTVSELLTRAGIEHGVITGENTPQEKEDTRRAFQRGDFPVIITSVTTGISLHAGEEAVNASDTTRRMIIADFHWSPREHLQLEGRINRNGKNGIITIPYLDGTIDEKVTKKLLTGLRNQSILQGAGEEGELELLASLLGIEIVR